MRKTNTLIAVNITAAIAVYLITTPIASLPQLGIFCLLVLLCPIWWRRVVEAPRGEGKNPASNLRMAALGFSVCAFLYSALGAFETVSFAIFATFVVLTALFRELSGVAHRLAAIKEDLSD